MRNRLKSLGLTLAALALASATPAAAEVVTIELDVAGYLCGM